MRHRRAKPGRWDRQNTAPGLIRRKAKADAKREAIAATRPPVPPDPVPGEVWQELRVILRVPGGRYRCDQHHVQIDGEVIGVLSASDLGKAVAARTIKRPSLRLLADIRRDVLHGAEVSEREELEAAAAEQEAARL